MNDGFLLYVFGPMTDHPGDNRAAFFLAGARLAESGYRLLNPANHPPGLTRRQYLDLDMPMVSVAQGLAALPGWQKSKGARAEAARAESDGTPIRTVEEWIALAAVPPPRQARGLRRQPLTTDH